MLVEFRLAGCRVVWFLQPYQRTADRFAAIGDADLAVLVGGVPSAERTGGECGGTTRIAQPKSTIVASQNAAAALR